MRTCVPQLTQSLMAAASGAGAPRLPASQNLRATLHFLAAHDSGHFAHVRAGVRPPSISGLQGRRRGARQQEGGRAEPRNAGVLPGGGGGDAVRARRQVAFRLVRALVWLLSPSLGSAPGPLSSWLLSACQPYLTTSALLGCIASPVGPFCRRMTYAFSAHVLLT